MTSADLVDRILGQLDQVRFRCPEPRFAQLIATIGLLAENETGHSLWDIEDSEFAAALERCVADSGEEARHAEDDERDREQFDRFA